MAIGHPEEALEHFTISLAIKERLRDIVGQGHTMTELARGHCVCCSAVSMLMRPASRMPETVPSGPI